MCILKTVNKSLCHRIKMTLHRLSIIALLLLLVISTRCKSNEPKPKHEKEVIDPILADEESLPEDEEEEEEEDASSSNRTKKALTPNKETKIVSMVFENEDVNTFTSWDFILRLQEKYEYHVCDAYLSSVADVDDNFFLFDKSLAEPEVGDLTDMEEKNHKRNISFPYRYHLFNETCKPDAEREFWYELFKIAENDTTKKGPPVQPQITINNFVHLQNTSRDLMHAWNKVWVQFKNRHVCNQKLLLECLPEEMWDDKYGYIPNPNSPNHRCLCRKNGIGLPTIHPPLKIGKRPMIATDAYTTQYYYDNFTFINSESLRDHGTYRKTLGCRVTVNLPDSHMDVQIVNPCDFFLPMIGMCRAECVHNASCASVDVAEKVAAKRRAEKKEAIRVSELKLHETYHNKCVCRKGTHCRKIGKESANRGEELRATWEVILFNFILVITSVKEFYFD